METLEVSAKADGAPTEQALPVMAYTPQEAWRLARISRSAFYAAVRDGTIPAIRIGKSIRIPKAKFDALFGIEAA